MSHYEDEDDFYGGSAQPGSGAEVADDQQQLGTSFYNSNRPAPPAALRPGSQIFQGFSQPPPTASLPDLPANGAHSLRPIHQSSEHSEPPASFSHIQKPLPDPRKPHSEPAKRPVSEHQPPADPEEHSRTRVSSFFLGSKQPETEFIDEDAAAAHGPNNEVNQSASFNSPPDSDPSRVLSARRSSFYGLENPPPSSQSASPRHDQPIPRSQTAQSGMSVASFRKSATDHGQWGRRRRDRTVSNRSSNYASSSCGDSPVPPAVPRLNQPTHLRPGASASLLSHAKTLDLYRANVKKTNDVEVTFEFASFILNIVHDLADDELDLEEFRVTSVNALAGNRRSSILSSSKPKIPGLKASPSNADALTQQGGNTASASSSSSSISRSPNPSAPGQPGSAESTSRSSFDYDLADTKRNALIVEAAQLLKKCAERGHQKSQILLGQLHILGSLSADGQADWQRAFPFLLQAGKHDHYQSAFRVGQAYENGWGTKKDPSKAVQWYRKSASGNDPSAMFRLGMAELKGELGLPIKAKEGFKWLNRTAERSQDDKPTEESILALAELGRLHEEGIEHVVFVDNEYAAECYAKAAELGHAQSAFKLGWCYEYGRMGCPKENALSVHYYNIAAQQGHPEACYGLTSWYMIGAENVLPQSDTEAFLWAKKAAEAGLSKAQFACGHFCETGTGTYKDVQEALQWYKKAAEAGDTRAVARIQQAQSAGANIPSSPQPVNSATKSKSEKRRTMAQRNQEDLVSAEKDDKNCIVS